jgi:SAM-dependent methyltransferase
VKPITIAPAAWPYLAAQKGRLDGLRHDRPAWEAAYRAHLDDTFAAIAPWLPQTCSSVLDVGGGMGGVDILIDRHYGGGLGLWILDGEAAPPTMNRHREPFSDMQAAAAMLAANGSALAGYCTPDKVWKPAPPADGFDLVLSLGSWCFHYEPAEYLDLVRQVARPGAVIILEVRHMRGDWWAELAKAFNPVGQAGASAKYVRAVYAA